MFNDIAKKLTGIETDLIKPNQNIRNDAVDPGAGSAYAQNQAEEQKGRIKLGVKKEEGEKKSKKQCC